MQDLDDLPESTIEKVRLVEAICLDAATYGTAQGSAYEYLRRLLIDDPSIRSLLPGFVRTYRDVSQVRTYAQRIGGYKDRREHIWQAFRPLLDHLEGINRAPADTTVADILASFDVEGVHRVWAKALERRESDPEGAITSARTLLETVCKYILDAEGVAYTDKEDLPALYRLVADRLSLAPTQQTEQIVRTILGSCQQVITQLGALRNKIGDAHGKGGKAVRPSSRHAHLAVNLAGAMATFLVETWLPKASNAAQTEVPHG
jgi:hypothetical protein